MISIANGRHFDQVVGDPLGDHRAVGEERDEKPLLLRVGVDVEEIAAREDLAAGVEQPQAAGVGELVEQAAMLVVIELAAARLAVAHRQVVVAVQAGERAAARDLDGAVQRQRAAPASRLWNASLNAP